MPWGRRARRHPAIYLCTKQTKRRSNATQQVRELLPRGEPRKIKQIKKAEHSLKKAAIYYRVSTDRQDLDSQRQAVEQWIAQLAPDRQPQTTTIFQDEGISGKTTNRPGFQAMLDAAYSKKIDTIIVYRLDRFSRNATTAIKLLLNLDECGVAFVSVTQPVLNLGHENPFRRTMLAAFAEIAEIERDTIVARVRAGLDAAKRRGVKLGAPTKISAEKQREARQLKDQGLSYKAIAARLELSVGSVHKLVNGSELTNADGAEA